MENYKKRQECSAQIEDVPKWRMIYDLLAEPTFLRPWLSMLVVTIGGIHCAGGVPLMLYLNTIIIKSEAPFDPYWIGAFLMIPTRSGHYHYLLSIIFAHILVTLNPVFALAYL